VVTLTGIIFGLRWFIDGLGNPILGAIADRIGRGRSITLIFLVGAASLITAVIHPRPIPMAILVLIFFTCGNTLYTMLSAEAGQNGTRSVASFATAMDLGMSMGPLVAWSIAQLGFATQNIFIAGAVIYVISASLSFKKFGI
jgi:predicted MFS family arabinose efflux permease